MKWAIVATIEQEIDLYTLELGWHKIMAQPGTIINIIIYDGVSPYIPDFGTKLEQVPDDAEMGDTGY